MENQRASQERQQKQGTAGTKAIQPACILHPDPFQEWRQLGKGCMRCPDSRGTHLWPLLLKQTHAALTARTLHSSTCCWAGKDYGLAKGSFLFYFVKIQNCDLLPISLIMCTWTMTFMLWFFHPACILPENHWDNLFYYKGTNHFGSKYIL